MVTRGERQSRLRVIPVILGSFVWVEKKPLNKKKLDFSLSKRVCDTVEDEQKSELDLAHNAD